MIDGLTIIGDWVTQAEEADLVGRLGRGPDRVRGHGRSRTERYGPGVIASGYTKSHKTEIVIPPHLSQLAGRLAAEGVLEPDAITVAWYLPRQGLAAHVDHPEAGEVIAILSLVGEATWSFRRIDDGESRTVIGRPRTLVVMAGEVRWHWTHEILPVTEPRISVVFRRSIPTL